jgi:hypothetical protein
MARALALVLCGIVVGSAATWWWTRAGLDQAPARAALVERIGTPSA